MAQDAAQRLMGKFIDADTEQPVGENEGTYIEFFMEAAPDPLLTEGGIIEKKNPRVKEIRKFEQDALAALRKDNPFTEEEPVQPKDTTPAVQRAYQQAHEEWDQRRIAHEDDLKEKATLLRDHHEVKDLLVVSPAGRPIFVDREYIRKVVPGDRSIEVVRPVRQEDIEAYRSQYNRWKSGQAQATSGTPLEQWPGVTRSQVKELAYFNVRTVEQLAAVSDANLSNIGSYTALRKKAQDWIATARGAAPIEEARAEAKRFKEELAEMKRQMAEMQQAQNRGNGNGNNQQQRR